MARPIPRFCNHGQWRPAVVEGRLTEPVTTATIGRSMVRALKNVEGRQVNFEMEVEGG